MTMLDIDPLYVLIGIGALTVAGLGLVAVCASLPSARRGITPPPAEAGESYRCYCWASPVTVRVVETPTGRHQRGRHRRPSYVTDSAVRPDVASHAGAGGGIWGAPPVHAVA